MYICIGMDKGLARSGYRRTIGMCVDIGTYIYVMHRYICIYNHVYIYCYIYTYVHTHGFAYFDTNSVVTLPGSCVKGTEN